jgi:hypothetical protein
MRQTARDLSEAAIAYVAAKEATTPLIHKLAVAVVQDLANQQRGAVRITLPGGVVIERAPQAQTRKP